MSFIDRSLALALSLLVVLAAGPAFSASTGLDTPTSVTVLPFSVQGIEMMDLTSTGLGIGITNPSYPLDVETGSTTAIYGSTAANGGWGGFFHNNDSGGNRYVQLAGGAYAGIFMNGNVGIGLTNPSYPLEANGAGYFGGAASSGYYGLIGAANYTLSGNGTIQTVSNVGSNWAGIFNNAAGPYGISTSNSSGYYAQLASSSYGLSTNGTVNAQAANGGNWAGIFQDTAGPYGIYTTNSSGYYAELAYSNYGLNTNGTINTSGTVSATQICLGGVCKTTWPGGHAWGGSFTYADSSCWAPNVYTGACSCEAGFTMSHQISVEGHNCCTTYSYYTCNG